MITYYNRSNNNHTLCRSAATTTVSFLLPCPLHRQHPNVHYNPSQRHYPPLNPHPHQGQYRQTQNCVPPKLNPNQTRLQRDHLPYQLNERGILDELTSNAKISARRCLFFNLYLTLPVGFGEKKAVGGAAVIVGEGRARIGRTGE